VFIPDAQTMNEISQRLASAGTTMSKQDDGSLRAADPDNIFIEFITRG
jgi:hypothetical protein